jgi:hypothetical protein
VALRAVVVDGGIGGIAAAVAHRCTGFNQDAGRATAVFADRTTAATAPAAS